MGKEMKKNRVIKFMKEPWATPNGATHKTCYPFPKKNETTPGKKHKQHLKRRVSRSNHAPKNSPGCRRQKITRKP